MKKTLLILVVVAMLLTSIAAALPVGAASVYATDEAEALKKAIDDAETVISDDTNVYLPEAWSTFSDVLVEAKQLYRSLEADEEKTDDEIKTMAKNMADTLISAISDLKNNKGKEIYSAEDFEKLDTYEGVFVLCNDIKVSKAVESFKGTLMGNGHTITLNGCGLFTEFSGEVTDLTVAGKAGEAKSVFGKAVGTAAVKNIKITVAALTEAVIFDALADKAEAKATNVLATCEAPVLSVEKTVLNNAYLQGVEYYGTDTKKKSNGEIGGGIAAYYINSAFGETLLVQVIGEDAFPVVGTVTHDLSNVVVRNESGKLVNDPQFAVSDPDGIEMPNLTEGVPELVVKEPLEKAIERAEALEKDTYVAESWQVLELALADAKEVLAKEDATQRMIDMAASSLTIQMANLKVKSAELPAVEVDYTELEAAIAEAGALSKDGYTEASWAKLKAAMAMAEVAKTATTQSAVNSAKSALNVAVKGLVKATVEETEATEDNNAATEPATEEGCGSVVGGAAVIAAVLAVGACVALKKKED